MSELVSVKKETAAESPWRLAQQPWQDYINMIEATRIILLYFFLLMFNHTFFSCYQLLVDAVSSRT